MTPETIRSALSMHPDRPGVGRLCQELLAEVTGLEITASVEASVRAPKWRGINGTPRKAKTESQTA